MSFFYDLNKKLDSIRATPDVTHKQLNERDMSRAAKGYEKYGKQGMEALAKAGREGKALDPVRKKYDKYDNTEVDEGIMDTVKSVGKKVASGINKLVGHGSDEDMRNDLKRKAGVPAAAPKQTPMDPKDEYDYFTGRDKVRGGEQQVKEKLSPAKQKSFAALAPPTDKITFADKIAGAKKEVDEMLGDVAAEAMRAALGKGKQTVQGMAEDQPTHFEVHYKDNQKGRTAKTKVKGSDAKQAKAAWNDWNSSNTPGRFTFVAAKPVATEMDEEKSKGTAFDMSTPRAATPKVGSIERGHKHDIKHTATGRMVTRRVDDQGNSVGADDDSAASGEKRGRGRPKGTTGAIGAKGPSGRSKLMTKEGNQEDGELKAAMALLKKAGYKVSKAMDEESTHTGDDHAEKAGKKVTKDIEYDEKKKDGIHGKKRGAEDAKAEKAGKKVAKDIEYDEKKKDKEVDESTTSGSVATSTATKSSKGSMVGKGIYDSMNRELENMIAESMSINMSDSTEGGKSLTITATDEDALKLGMLLKSAGLGGGDAHGGDMHSHGEEACDTCGMQDCGCGDVQEAVDENSPDWPTNTETSNDAMQYAGGLNKPKTDVAGDGQTTIPNTAVHAQDEDALRRMMEMAGIKQAELEPWKETMKEDAEEDATDAENAVNDAEAAEDEIQEDFAESIQRMREIAGIREAKKDVEEEKTEEGNLFTGNLAKARADGKKQADLDGDGDMEKVRESIFALNNQWQAYKG
jgi:hypothetical protein